MRSQARCLLCSRRSATKQPQALNRPVKTTRHFEEEVLRKRPNIRREWCERALQDPLRRVVQADGRIRHWIYVEELGKYLRVVTLADGETVHTAFPDRGFPRE